MIPPSENVHWMFATALLAVGLFLLAESIVGPDVWRRRPWRKYLWPGVAFLIGLFMWPVMVFFTNSTMHMLAHGAWAQVMMLTGAAELGLASGKLKRRLWRLTSFLAFLITGIVFLAHEQNPWLFQRSSFLHHLIGWTLVGAAIFPLGRTFRPRTVVFAGGFALTFVTVAIMLYCDRDLAPIFGHLSPVAGTPQR